MSGSRDMTLQVIVKLRDELSRGLDGALGKIRSWAMRTTALFSSVGRGIADLGQRFAAFGLGAGLSLSKGLQSFVDFDKAIRGSAVILDKSGAAAEAWIKTQATTWSTAAKAVGQTSMSLAETQSNLLGALGSSAEDVAKKMTADIGYAATASSAAIADLTATAKVFFQSWGFQPDEMRSAFGKAFVAGNLGNFELKDMAQFLPELAPNTAMLGLRHNEALASVGAFLQVAKMGEGTASGAATDFRDFINQITSAHFKKRMSDQGVDVDAVLKDAAKKNINPIEAIIGKIVKITGAGDEARRAAAEASKKGLSQGDTEKLVESRVTDAIKASKLGEVLINQYGKTFMATLLAHIDEYKAMRDAIRSADTAPMDRAFETQMAGPEAKQRMAAERWEQVLRRAGEALTWVFDAASKAADGLDHLFKAADALSPKLVDLAVNVAAVVSAIAGVLGVLSFFGRGAGAAAAAGGAATAATMTVGASTAAGSGGGGLLGGLAGLVGRGAGLASRSGAGLLGALYFASEALQRAFPTTKEGMQYRLDAGPIDFATYERAWRAEQEWRRDPEAARGRAMMNRSGVALPDPIARHALGDLLPDVKIGKPNLSFEAITGSKAPDLAHMIGAAFAGMLKTAGAKPAPQEVKVETKVTVKVDGPGVVTSQSSTTSGASSADRGPTVGRP